MNNNRNLAPTKTNLNKMKDELKFAQQGHDLLDQKRNILVMELMGLIDQATEFEQRADAMMAQAYKALQMSVMENGRLKTSSLALSVNIESEIMVKNRRVMGVPIPVINTTFKDHPPYYSAYGVGIYMDDAVKAFKNALELMGHLSELKIGIMRLASEVKRTIRKVNALEQVVMPNAHEVIMRIEGRLEENERDMFVLMKSVKQHLNSTERG
jgi:V/A-type H+-transporting ATPase subunit D